MRKFLLFAFLCLIVTACRQEEPVSPRLKSDRSLLALFSGQDSPQNQARIILIATDACGKRLANCRISLLHTETHQDYEVFTNAEGLAEFIGPAGNYEMEASTGWSRSFRKASFDNLHDITVNFLLDC